MADRPILFSGAMVKALLDGRKSQTRRAPPPDLQAAYTRAGDALLRRFPHQRGAGYEVGDRLWVREALRYSDEHSNFYYAADNRGVGNAIWERLRGDVMKPAKSRPSIHMPRWASRITLLVTDVRIQRLQDISEEDARAEGATMRPACNGFQGRYDGWSMDWSRVGQPSKFARNGVLAERDISLSSARMAFASYWNEINGGGAWDKNPWVTAVSFTTHLCNIDALPSAVTNRGSHDEPVSQHAQRAPCVGAPNAG